MSEDIKFMCFKATQKPKNVDMFELLSKLPSDCIISPKEKKIARFPILSSTRRTFNHREMLGCFRKIPY